MKNFVQMGRVLALTAEADITSGTMHKVGAIVGVAAHDALAGNLVSTEREGVFTLPKTSAQAWTEGVKVYWDDTAKVVTSTASGNTLIGAAALAAANPSSEGTVLLTGQI